MFDEIVAILLTPITDRLEYLVATVEELQTQIADVKSSLADAIGRVEDDVENLKTQLADRIDPTALDPISQGLADLKGNLDALDPDPSNPAAQ